MIETIPHVQCGILQQIKDERGRNSVELDERVIVIIIVFCNNVRLVSQTQCRIILCLDVHTQDGGIKVGRRFQLLGRQREACEIIAGCRSDGLNGNAIDFLVGLGRW